MPVRESIFVQTHIGAYESPFHGNHKLMQAASIKSTYQMLRAAPNANKDMYTAGYETMESMSKLVDNMRKSSIAVEQEINGMMMEEFSSKYTSEMKVKEIFVALWANMNEDTSANKDSNVDESSCASVSISSCTCLPIFTTVYNSASMCSHVCKLRQVLPCCQPLYNGTPMCAQL